MFGIEYIPKLQKCYVLWLLLDKICVLLFQHLRKDL